MTCLKFTAFSKKYFKVQKLTPLSNSISAALECSSQGNKIHEIKKVESKLNISRYQILSISKSLNNINLSGTVLKRNSEQKWIK